MNGLRIIVAMLAWLPFAAWSAPGDLPLRTNGWYLGVGAGYAQVDLQTPATDVGGNDFAFKLFTGYRLNQALLPWNMSVGFDLGYVNLGEVTDNQLNTEFALEVDGVDLSVVGYLPITRRLDLFGKVGVYLWDATFATGDTTLDKDSGTDLSYGLGIALQTGGQWSAQVEIEGYDMLDGALVATVSAIYQFK